MLVTVVYINVSERPMSPFLGVGSISVHWTKLTLQAVHHCFPYRSDRISRLRGLLDPSQPYRNYGRNAGRDATRLHLRWKQKREQCAQALLDAVGLRKHPCATMLSTFLCREDILQPLRYSTTCCTTLRLWRIPNTAMTDPSPDSLEFEMWTRMRMVFSI